MKYIVLKSVFLSLLLTTIGGCSRDFLEVVPKGKLIADKTADYDLFLNAIETYITSETLTYSGDEVAVLEPYYSAVSPIIRRKIDWADDFYDPDQVGNEMSGFMPMLYSLNKVISEVMDSKGGTEAEKLSLLAEARSARAWLYFYLINLYGKPYNEATSATDLGFPIMATADVTIAHFTRNSVKEVYDFIVKDLTESIPHLPETITFRQRMSKPAAQAILGKVYVFMRDFAAAELQFNAVFEQLNKGSGLSVKLYDYSVATAPGGPLQTQPMMGPMQPIPAQHEEVLFIRQQLNVSAGQFGNNVVLRPEAAALYTLGDLRFLKFYATGPMGAPPAGDFKVNPRVYRRLGGDVNIGAYLPDIYLLRAESRARMGNLAGAIEDVETLRKNRMPVSEAMVDPQITQGDLVQFIIDERIREFAVQGYRWLDMRRLSVDPAFAGTIHDRVVYNADGSVKTTFVLRPERLTFRLPLRSIEENPGMQNNP